MPAKITKKGEAVNIEDNSLIRLYFERSEQAIEKTAEKYKSYCHTIAYGILKNQQDSEECVNDVFLKAWDSIPPAQPKSFSAFLAKITRNLAIDKYRMSSSKKRSGAQYDLALEELSECIGNDNDNVENRYDEALAADALNRFLETLSIKKRNVFIRRYWYFDSIKDISQKYGIGESSVKMILKRTRESLKEFLEKEGIEI